MSDKSISSCLSMTWVTHALWTVYWLHFQVSGRCYTSLLYITTVYSFVLKKNHKSMWIDYMLASVVPLLTCVWYFQSETCHGPRASGGPQEAGLEARGPRLRSDLTQLTTIAGLLNKSLSLTKASTVCKVAMPGDKLKKMDLILKPWVSADNFYFLLNSD